MAILRVQSVFSHTSGLVRDKVVNTWHFEGLISPASLLAIDAAVDNFYRQVDGLTGNRVDENYSTAILNVQNKIYDVTTEPSGPPLLVSLERPLAATRVGTANLPEEVAISLSFAGTPEAGLVQSRRRGRVYLGPLRNTTIEYVPAVGTRVSDSFSSTARRAAKRLAVEVDTFAEWVVYSRPYAGRAAIIRPGKSTLPAIAARPGTTVNIDEVSMDNAVDTQRRRGPKATSRVTELTGE